MRPPSPEPNTRGDGPPAQGSVTRDPPPGEADPLALVKAELAAKDRKIISLEGMVAQRENEIRGLEAALAAVYASTTWKLGAPLRLGKSFLGRMARVAGREQLAPAEPTSLPV